MGRETGPNQSYPVSKSVVETQPKRSMSFYRQSFYGAVTYCREIVTDNDLTGRTTLVKTLLLRKSPHHTLAGGGKQARLAVRYAHMLGGAHP